LSRNGEFEPEGCVYDSEDHYQGADDEFMGFYHPGWELSLFVGAVVEEAEDPLDDYEEENDDSDDLVGVGEIFGLF
jgi:hypothetical protein